MEAVPLHRVVGPPACSARPAASRHNASTRAAATIRSLGDPYPDTRGTVLTENNWLRSWSNDLYLWYNEIVDRDPSLYTTAAYFDLLKTTATTASGKPKDQFHFTMPTSDFVDFAQSGISAGYGATWALIAARPPRQIVVAYTDPGTPAVGAGVNLARGATVLQVDGVDAVNDGSAAAVDTLNAGLFPTAAGESHTFVRAGRRARPPRVR